MHPSTALLLLCLLLQPAHSEVLWSSPRLPGELRRMTAGTDRDRLRLTVQPGAGSYAWAVFPAPETGWDLGGHATVEAGITNLGVARLRLLLWVVGDHGWDAVPGEAVLEPGQTRRLTCNLRETWPDGTPKIDPRRVRKIQLMAVGAGRETVPLALRSLEATGTAAPWEPPAARLGVPPVEDGPPRPGKRVRFRLPGQDPAAAYAILHLPEDWQPGSVFPVIAEWPGNIFFTTGCYSTGLPEQCVIGHGIARGRGAICLGLPFVDRTRPGPVEDGWGNPDETAAHTVQMVEEVCSRFGGDRNNILATGFSRGALACGFIGLRDDRIAALWKGIHACQHHDGDGWRGATLAGAVERAKRFRGRAVFLTDNSLKAFRPVSEAMGVPVTGVSSGLGAHATTMFLDDRPSTVQLRDWFRKLVVPNPIPSIPP